MQRTLILGSAAAAMLLTLAGCGQREDTASAPAPAPAAAPASEPAAAPPPATAAAPAAGGGDVLVVRIGHVAPMSGPQAHYGKDNENGVRMALEELNAQNITIGGKRAQKPVLE